jgi:hypothetical protein
MFLRPQNRLLVVYFSRAGRPKRKPSLRAGLCILLATKGSGTETLERRQMQ